MKAPGWGGFFMGMTFAPSVLVVVFQINIADLTLCGVDAEC
jgi:hypothetical protein